MGLRILGSDDGAVLYCSVTMTAFGRVFNCVEQAEHFLAWLKGQEEVVRREGSSDPRRYSTATLYHVQDKYLVECPNWCYEADCHRCRGPVHDTTYGHLCDTHVALYLPTESELAEDIAIKAKERKRANPNAS